MKEQTNIIQSSDSTATNQVPFASLPPLPDTQSSCILRRTCSEVSIYHFKLAHCQNNYTGLIIEGQPTDAQLQDAWAELVFEYSGLIKNANTEGAISLQGQIGEMQYHLMFVDAAIMLIDSKITMGEEVPDHVKDELAELGYHGEFDVTHPEICRQELNRIRSMAKTVVHDLQVLLDQQDMIEKTNSGKKQTVEDMDRNVAMFSKFMHYRIDQKETFMDEYAQIYNLYVDDIAHQAKQKR